MVTLRLNLLLILKMSIVICYLLYVSACKHIFREMSECISERLYTCVHVHVGYGIIL